MLRVPRSIDEIDPLPEMMDAWDSKGPRGPFTKREVAEVCNHSARSNGPDWIPVKGKPHLYTKGGKLKYAPPLPPSEIKAVAWPDYWLNELVTLSEWPLIRLAKHEISGTPMADKIEWTNGDRISVTICGAWPPPAFEPTWRTPDGRTLKMQDGWYPHIPGDPMPCDDELMVEMRFGDGEVERHPAGELGNWPWCPSVFGAGSDILAWRPAS